MEQWREIDGSGTLREIDIVLQSLDMVVPDGEGSYLAAPISTGRRYYQALAQHGVSTYPELIAAAGLEWYLKTVRWPNVADGERTAANLRARGVPFLINTGPLMISGWQGADYMDACFRLIQKKIRRVYFHPEWAFSRGAAQEFLFCTRNHLPCFRSDGQALSTADARAAMAEVCAYLASISVPATPFETTARELGECILHESSHESSRA